MSGGVRWSPVKSGEVRWNYGEVLRTLFFVVSESRRRLWTILFFDVFLAFAIGQARFSEWKSFKNVDLHIVIVLLPWIRPQVFSPNEYFVETCKPMKIIGNSYKPVGLWNLFVFLKIEQIRNLCNVAQLRRRAGKRLPTEMITMPCTLYNHAVYTICMDT